MKKINEKLRSLNIFAILVSILVMTVGCSNVSDDNTLTIGIIQYSEHLALDSARKGFIEALDDNGYVDGKNIKIDYQNAQGDQSNLSTISDRFVSEDVDLILAIATPAAQSVAGKTTEIPILGTAITDFVSAKLATTNEEPGGNVTGTSDLNPVKEQVELLARLVPDVKTIGVMYTSSEDNSILQASLAKEVIENLGLEYEEVTVTNSNDVQQATQSIVGRCDAIYIPTDNVFASAMPMVHSVTMESKTPVVAGADSMVVDGALATIGINYKDLGYQTGIMATKILKDGVDPATMPIETAETLHHIVNGLVAEEIGIEIPDDLVEYIIENNN